MTQFFGVRTILLKYFFDDIVRSSDAHNLFSFALLQEERAGGDDKNYKPIFPLLTQEMQVHALKQQSDERNHAIQMERARTTYGWKEDASWPSRLHFSAYLMESISDFQRELDDFPVVLYSAMLAHIIEENAVNFFIVYREVLGRHQNQSVFIEMIDSMVHDERDHSAFTMDIITAYRSTYNVGRLERIIKRILGRARRRWLRVLIPLLRVRIRSTRFECLSTALLMYARLP